MADIQKESPRDLRTHMELNPWVRTKISRSKCLKHPSEERKLWHRLSHIPSAVRVGVRCAGGGGGVRGGGWGWKVLVIGILITKENDDKIFMDLGVLQ